MQQSPGETFMAQEIAEIPAVLQRQAEALSPVLERIAEQLRRRRPPLLVTIARGSSDHAALYLKYLVEILLGIPCASIGPSIASIYHAPLQLPGAVAITITQSGRSPDLIALQDAARCGGALTIAIVNDIGSPVAIQADICVPLAAGPERSVAATKTMVASLAVGAGLAAAWSGDGRLAAALAALPGRLAMNQSPVEDVAASLAGIRSAFVLGRGATLSAAAETALKLKETCSIHAEAFSSAEVLHGPAAVLEAGFPILCLMAQDEAQSGMEDTLDRLRAMGAACFTVGTEPDSESNRRIETVDPGHPLLAPIPMLQTMYRLTERIARYRGRDPDRPPHLAKITRTL